MKIIQATAADLPAISLLVHKTINAIYFNYYPQEVVESFLEYHREENILADIESGWVYLLTDSGSIVATGTVKENYMNRIFVLPEWQGKGYGSVVMDFLEDLVLQRYDAVYIDSSLPGFKTYWKRRYEVVDFGEFPTRNGRILFYPVMRKTRAAMGTK